MEEKDFLEELEIEKTEVEEGQKEDNKDEYETYTEVETLNSMVPLWKKNRNEIKPEEYNAFYKEKFFVLWLIQENGIAAERNEVLCR